MTNLRAEALRLFDVAIKAADPARALRAGMAANPVPKPINNGQYIIVSVGKAAVPMAREALCLIGDVPARVLVVTNYENACDLAGARVIAAGHPVPDENGRIAGEAVAQILTEAGANDRVLALISGGGSALLPAPVPGLSLDDKATVNRLLLAGGFDISEMNLVRQQLSRLKGGGMVRLAAPAPVSAFILSDVIGDDLRVIASGPTVAPLGTKAQARDLLKARGIWADLPAHVRAILEQTEPAGDTPPKADNHLIGSNRKSLEAIEKASDVFKAVIVSDRLEGDVSEACGTILKAARDIPAGHPACLIFGGETTVTLRGNGQGGRNQELALRMAIAAPDVLTGREWVFLSGGTDGRDGPTEAAGGIVDAGSLARLRAAGADALALLANNDSNAALAASGDLVVTGATGTNVADVQILLLGS
jgi:glycerate 2-kinase